MLRASGDSYPHGDSFRDDHLAESFAKRGGRTESEIEKVLGEL